MDPTVERRRAGRVMMAAAVLASSCATPAAVRRIAAASPGAEYDATAAGCERRVRSAGRHLGRDLRSAWRWTHQLIGGAAVRRCEVQIEAVSEGLRHIVYRAGRDSVGRRTEEVLPGR